MIAQLVPALQPAPPMSPKSVYAPWGLYLWFLVLIRGQRAGTGHNYIGRQSSSCSQEAAALLNALVANLTSPG
jgi:hypothetical protein